MEGTIMQIDLNRLLFVAADQGFKPLNSHIVSSINERKSKNSLIRTLKKKREVTNSQVHCRSVRIASSSC